MGMGHLMRCLGLAQMAASRGWRVTMIGDFGDAGAAVLTRLSPEVEVIRSSRQNLDSDVRAALVDGVDVLHFDTYADVPAVVHGGVLVSNMQDGPYGVRPAGLAIDSNLGAENSFARADLSTAQLAGVDVAVVRSQVLRARDTKKSVSSNPRVLVVMGGTDPNQLTPRVVRALGRILFPLDVTIVAVGRSEQVAEAAAASPHNIEIVDFVEDLPALARQHDLAITAAGTSVWDFACMGLPMALICVVDNQRGGFQAAMDAGLAVSLGYPPHDDLEERMGYLATLLADPAWLARQARVLREAVDGRGAWRIVSAWEQIAGRTVVPGDQKRDVFAARPAELSDVRLLFEWRNDETTRVQSRSQGELNWDAHRAWLENVIADPNRRLLILELEDEPIATVRWDRSAETDWEVSVTIAPQQRGRGFGRDVLSAAEEALRLEPPFRMIADIHVDNHASRRLFSAAGYLPQLPPDADGFERRAKWRLPLN